MQIWSNFILKIFEILVQEVKPGNAVTIVECDMNVSRGGGKATPAETGVRAPFLG